MDKSAPESGSTETTTPKAAAPNPPSPTKNASRPVKKGNTKKAASLWPLTLLVIVLFGLSAAASVYLWQELNKQDKLAERSKNTNAQLAQQVSQLNRSLSDRIKQLESASTAQSELITTLDKLALFNTKELNRLHASNRVDWLLAEAEYLLRLGNQRLTIERDVKGAEAIIMAADKVLTEIEDPSILPIRQVLQEEILALQSVSKIDRDGIYLQIQAIINALDELHEGSFLKADDPIVSATPEPEAQPSSYLEQLWQTVWSDLKKALVIRRLDQPVAPLLAPEQSYYLKQNLQLMLEQAGLAVLNEDDDTFQKNLTKAENWLANYFVQTDTKIEAIKTTLKGLKQARLKQDLPDISQSLRLLKTKVEAMYRAHQLDRVSTLADEQKTQQAPKNSDSNENPSDTQEQTSL